MHHRLIDTFIANALPNIGKMLSFFHRMLVSNGSISLGRIEIIDCLSCLCRSLLVARIMEQWKSVFSSHKFYFPSPLIHFLVSKIQLLFPIRLISFLCLNPRRYHLFIGRTSQFDSVSRSARFYCQRCPAVPANRYGSSAAAFLPTRLYRECAKVFQFNASVARDDNFTRFSGACFPDE